MHQINSYDKITGTIDNSIFVVESYQCTFRSWKKIEDLSEIAFPSDFQLINRISSIRRIRETINKWLLGNLCKYCHCSIERPASKRHEKKPQTETYIHTLATRVIC